MTRIEIFAGNNRSDYRFAIGYTYYEEWWRLHEFKKLVPTFKIRPNGHEGYQ